MLSSERLRRFQEEDPNDDEEREGEMSSSPSRPVQSPKSQQSNRPSSPLHGLVEPPESVRKVLDLLRSRKETEYDAFNEFLIQSQQAVDTAKSMKLSVEASYKLISGLPPEKTADDDQNDTLCLIFDFYARIRQHNSSKTFSEQLLSFQTMNFSKLEVFCRDFEIIPKLLTREDVKMMWEDIGREHVAKGLGIFTVIDFTEFKDLIIRMALWAYYKPGLKKLILAVDGFLPKPIEMVNYFCTYLKLYDEDYIHNFLRTVGRKTQGDYNYRSKDEMNLRTKVEVRVDTNARSLKQVTRKSTSTAKVDAFGDKVKNQIIALPAHPKRVITNQYPVFEKLQRLKAAPQVIRPQFPEVMKDRFEDLRNNKTKLTAKDALEEKEREEGLDGEEEDGAKTEGIAAMERYRAEVAQQMKKAQITIKDSSPSNTPYRIKDGKLQYTFRPEGFNQSREDADFDEEEDYSRRGSSISSTDHHHHHHDNSLEALKEIFESNYDPRLASELLKYTYVPPRAVVVDWIPTHGPLVDLGLLEAGIKVTINYRVVNDTADEILIDATTRNFGGEDTDVKMFTKPLVPGLSRIITVSFTVPATSKVYFGRLELTIVNVRNRVHSYLYCPLFYYVDPLLEKPMYPNVNARALADLLYQRVYRTNTPSDITRRRVNTNFSTRRSAEGTWTLTNKFSTGMNSLNATSSVPRGTFSSSSKKYSGNSDIRGDTNYDFAEVPF